MPRTAHGGAFESRGRFYMRVTVAPRERPAKLLPWATSLAQAYARAVATQELVSRLRAADQTDFIEKLVESAAKADEPKMAALVRAVDGIVGGTVEKKPEPLPKGPALTFRKFAERWTNGELTRDFPDHVRSKRTADDDICRLEKHVYRIIGDDELANPNALERALEVMRELPADLSPASRRHVAQLMTRVYALAVYPCRLLKASPLPRGFLPKLRRQKAKSALYPDEEAKLLAGDPANVPLVARMLYGFLAREGMRSSEALRLMWSDLDLERGAVRLDRNKTDDPRAWALDQGTAEALRRYRMLLGEPPATALVFGAIENRGHLAPIFREHLELVGVSRAELFEDSNARRPVRLHDLRATFVTVALAAGRSEAFVTQRTGHRSSTQVAGYRRLAQTFADVGASAWFVDMADAIPELAAAAKTAAEAAAGATDDARDDDLSVEKCTGRDLNPHALRRWNLKPRRRGATSSDAQDSRGGEDADRADQDELGPPLPPPAATSDLDAALARAVDAATAAGRFDLVEQLVKELQARRLALGRLRTPRLR